MASARQLHISDNFTLVNQQKRGLGVALEFANQRVIDTTLADTSPTQMSITLSQDVAPAGPVTFVITSISGSLGACAGIRPIAVICAFVKITSTATGVLVREHPGLQVHVSGVGAPHLVDPARLEASARRLYGDTFDTLWGELAAVPQENIHIAEGDVVGLECFPTPGHASHHVCYLAPDGTAQPGAVGRF